MKKRSYFLILCLVSLLVFGTFPIRRVAASIIWEDNFDDNNYDGWTKHGAAEPAYDLDFGVIGGAVYVNDTTGAWAWLIHPSTVSVGHWSFDLYQPTDGAGPVDFFFMCNWTTWEDIEGYSLHIQCFTDNEPLIYLWGWDGSFNGGNSFLISYNHDSQIEDTWSHFDVTCDSSGEINVYLNSNSTPIIQYSGVTYNSSEVFMISAGQYFAGDWAEFGMDNVVVDDDENYVPPEPTTTPTPTPTPTPTGNGEEPPPDMTMMLLIAGGGVVVIVVLVIVVKMRSS